MCRVFPRQGFPSSRHQVSVHSSVLTLPTRTQRRPHRLMAQFHRTVLPLMAAPAPACGLCFSLTSCKSGVPRPLPGYNDLGSQNSEPFLHSNWFIVKGVAGNADEQPVPFLCLCPEGPEDRSFVPMELGCPAPCHLDVVTNL